MDLYNVLSWVESIWDENDKKNKDKNKNNEKHEHQNYKNNDNSETKQMDESDRKSLELRLSFDDLHTSQVCVLFFCSIFCVMVQIILARKRAKKLKKTGKT